MKRRSFIAALGGAAAWPVVARAQQNDRMKRVGILFNLAADDPETMVRIPAFHRALAALGWTDGRNVRFDTRHSAGDADRLHKYVAELIALAPDVILAEGSPTVGPLLQATRSVPIVFVNVVDPVGSGYVASFARPGGNATGFSQFEYRISGKWLELLKEIAPNISQVAVIRDSRIGSSIGQFAVIQTVAPSVGVELFPINATNAPEIERGVAAFARSQNGGLIVTAGGTAFHRDVITSLAERYRLPAVYPFRYYATDGGLISYGPNSIDPTVRAASYVDRILKGEKPPDLPVQVPTKYELIINLKAAKAIGLTVPPNLLARADEVIE